MIYVKTFAHLYSFIQAKTMQFPIGKLASGANHEQTMPLSYTKISGDRALDYNKRTNKKLGRFDVAVSCRYSFQIGVYITANDVILCRNDIIENKQKGH